METENYIKSIEELLASGPISTQVDKTFAESKAERWKSSYESYINFINENPGNADPMKESKLWMDYRNKIRPNLVLANIDPRGYDTLANGLMEKDNKSYGSCPNC